MTREIVIDALRMAWFKRHPGKRAGLLFHSDQGSQYASEDFRAELKDYGISASMSRCGNCWDNACSETLFGSLKVERLYGQRLLTRRHAKDETRSEEHTSELQSLMRSSYAVFCLKKKKQL